MVAHEMGPGTKDDVRGPVPSCPQHRGNGLVTLGSCRNGKMTTRSGDLHALLHRDARRAQGNVTGQLERRLHVQVPKLALSRHGNGAGVGKVRERVGQDARRMGQHVAHVDVWDEVAKEKRVGVAYA